MIMAAPAVMIILNPLIFSLLTQGAPFMFSRFIARFEENVLVLLLVVLTLTVFYEVILRFVFSVGILWIQEFTLITSAWFVLIGASYGIKVGAHIGIDVFVRMLGPAAQKFIGLLAVALALVYCGMFLYSSWLYLSDVFTYADPLEDTPIPGLIYGLLAESTWEALKVDTYDPRIPVWFADGPLLICFTLLGIRLLQVGHGIIKGTAQGFTFADEARDAMEHVTDDDARTPARNDDLSGDSPSPTQEEPSRS